MARLVARCKEQVSVRLYRGNLFSRALEALVELPPQTLLYQPQAISHFTENHLIRTKTLCNRSSFGRVPLSEHIGVFMPRHHYSYHVPYSYRIFSFFVLDVRLVFTKQFTIYNSGPYPNLSFI
jgi:hypothetical protein